MKKIQIAVTFWNRFPVRLECLKKVYNAIEKYTVFGDYEHEWIISCETDRCVNKNDVNEFLKSKSNIKYFWKETPATLASNLNNLLKSCTAPLIFYLQDDFLLIKQFHINKYADFLLSTEYDIIRCCVGHDFNNLKGPQHIKLIDSKLKLYEISHEATNLYSDHPHLKKKTFHENYGYFPKSTDKGYDSGDCEMKFNKMIKKTNTNIAIIQEYFDHDKRVYNKDNATLEERWKNWWINENIKNAGTPNFLHLGGHSTLEDKWLHWRKKVKKK